MREAPKSSWKRVATVGPDVTTYNVPNMKEKEEHFFRVYAENKVGRSDALTSDGVTVKSQFGKLINVGLFLFQQSDLQGPVVQN